MQSITVFGSFSNARVYTRTSAAITLTIASGAANEGTKVDSLFFQTFAGPAFCCRGVGEHSSVMSMVFVSSYIKR